MSLEREQVCSHLKELADEAYQKFQSKLCPGTERILGIRTPVLRAYARELVKAYGQELIGMDLYLLQPEVREQLYYEEKLLMGMLLCLWKPADAEAMKQMLTCFLPLIDNWAVCDGTCSGLKYVGKHKEEFYPLFQEYLKSRDTYTVRFGVVMLMNYYIEEHRLEELYQLYEQIHHEDYYVKMAVAWAYSILLVKFFEPTFAYLSQCALDTFTFQKTIQKACESRRIDENQRIRLRELKQRSNSSAKAELS